MVLSNTRKQQKGKDWRAPQENWKHQGVPKMGPIKDKNGGDLVDTEEIEMRWKEYTEELYKKGLNEPDCCNGFVSHPESVILECKVKWALRSTTVNKASGCDEIPAELFRSLKDEAINVLHSLCEQSWKNQQ